jgi:hypothetical protein
MFDDEYENEFPPIPEADEICPLLPPNMQQPGAQWPCRVCGCTEDDLFPLDKCLSERVQIACGQEP